MNLLMKKKLMRNNKITPKIKKINPMIKKINKLEKISNNNLMRIKIKIKMRKNL